MYVSNCFANWFRALGRAWSKAEKQPLKRTEDLYQKLMWDASLIFMSLPLDVVHISHFHSQEVPCEVWKLAFCFKDSSLTWNRERWVLGTPGHDGGQFCIVISALMGAAPERGIMLVPILWGCNLVFKAKAACILLKCFGLYWPRRNVQSHHRQKPGFSASLSKHQITFPSQTFSGHPFPALKGKARLAPWSREHSLVYPCAFNSSLLCRKPAGKVFL